MWRSQSASPSLSRISLSAVARSGMRSSASATHISSTPSSLDRSYWRMKASTISGSAPRTRVRSTRPVATACTCACSASGRRAASSRPSRCPASSACHAAVIRARSGAGGPGSSGLRIGVTGVQDERASARENADSSARPGGAKGGPSRRGHRGTGKARLAPPERGSVKSGSFPVAGRGPSRPGSRIGTVGPGSARRPACRHRRAFRSPERPRGSGTQPG